MWRCRTVIDASTPSWAGTRPLPADGKPARGDIGGRAHALLTRGRRMASHPLGRGVMEKRTRPKRAGSPSPLPTDERKRCALRTMTRSARALTLLVAWMLSVLLTTGDSTAGD